MNEPTAIAKFLLTYAIQEPDRDKMLEFTYQFFEPAIEFGRLTPKDIKALQKEIGKVNEIEHHLARMLHRVPVPDPNEQLEIFEKERTSPNMWDMRDLQGGEERS